MRSDSSNTASSILQIIEMTEDLQAEMTSSSCLKKALRPLYKPIINITNLILKLGYRFLSSNNRSGYLILFVSSLTEKFLLDGEGNSITNNYFVLKSKNVMSGFLAESCLEV